MAEYFRYVAVVVSIRAPAWGATPPVCVGEVRRRVSIRAPAWGATRALLWSRGYRGRFNPRPRVGGDPPCLRR